MQGWRFRYVHHLAVPATLPNDTRTAHAAGPLGCGGVQTACKYMKGYHSTFWSWVLKEDSLPFYCKTSYFPCAFNDTFTSLPVRYENGTSNPMILSGYASSIDRLSSHACLGQEPSHFIYFVVWPCVFDSIKWTGLK